MIGTFSKQLMLAALFIAAPAQATDATELRKLLGYGGFIHNLKNYVLRNDNTHHETAALQLEQSLQILNDTLAANPGHEHALALNATLTQYREQLATAQRMIEAGADPATVDDAIMVNDSAALAALERWDAQDNLAAERAALTVQGIQVAALVAFLIAAAIYARYWRARTLTRRVLAKNADLEQRDRHIGLLLSALSEVRDTAGIAIFEYDAQTRNVHKSNSLASLFQGDSTPKTLGDALALFPEQCRELVKRNLSQSAALDTRREFEADGGDMRLRITLEPINDGASVLCMVQRQLTVPRESLEEQRKTLSDLADTRADRIRKLRAGLKKAQIDLVNLQKAAHKDPLTNTLNRLGFGERLRSEVQRARRKDQTLGILMVDIDHFKEVNDTYGHAVGDNALQLLANTLEGLVRSQGGDIVGRLGGDEFIVVLADATAAHGERTLKMARTMLNEEPIPDCPDETRRVKISGGAVTLNPATDEPGEVIKLADAALYRQKEVRHLHSSTT